MDVNHVLARNRYALKEWAIVVKALSSGRQILLLRKGGIMEERADFTVEHTQFFLYPTYVHEQTDRVVPEVAKELEAILLNRPKEDRVILSSYGVVEEAIVLNDFKQVESLRPYHILADDEVERRFYYRRPGLHLLLLRVYRMSRPIELPVSPAYAGCKSWVDLERELPTSGCHPILSDESFEERLQAIHSILQLGHAS